MKTALIKDTFREIRRSFSRFLSIFMIVFLGCGFYAGVNATMPDMIKTAEIFYEKNNLMDIRLVSTIGIKAEDIAAVKRLECVDGVMAGYSKDVLYNYKNQNFVLKFMSYNEKLKGTENDLNNFVLYEGRLPENPGECVVDEKFFNKDDNIEIGNKITVTSPDKTDINSIFRTDTFEVVGFVTSPLYVGYERDNTTVGNGSVYGYVYISEDDFALDYYSEMFLTLNECDYPPYSDEYKERVSQCEKIIKKAFTESVEVRYNSLYNLYNDRITSATNTVAKLEELVNSDISTLETLRTELQKTLFEYEKQAQIENTNILTIKINQAKSRLKELETLINAVENNDTEMLEGFYQQIEDAKAEIEAGKQQLLSISGPITLSYDRYSISDYGSFYEDSQKIHSIGKVFPVFFIIVAALVCLTTMTRMIEEQRTQIGTYKAMGYTNLNIASKYLVYGVTASAAAGFTGTLVGVKILPVVIYNCYKILYNIPEIDTPFYFKTTFACVLVSVVLTAVTVMYSCYKELASQPSQLMRPKAPKSGKRVLLERFPKIWNKISFIGKVTVRNLLRYKKRFFMTVLGIGGCTALILTGFGLKHSISQTFVLQFEKVFKYDGIAMLNTIDFDSDDCQNALSSVEGVKSTFLTSQVTAEVKENKKSHAVSIFIGDDLSEIDNYINLVDVKNNKPLTIDDDGVVVTAKLAQLLDVEKGDKINVDLGEKGSFDLKVSSVCENYAMHYIYCTTNYYKSAVMTPEYNSCLFLLDEGYEKDEISFRIVNADEIISATFLEDHGDAFAKNIGSLTGIVWLLIGCAGALAMVVLYNLANINITERIREIATVKVLGFYDNETSAYIYRENIISTFIGIAFGWVMGIFLHKFVVLTAEVDIVMFDRSIQWTSFLYSALLTMLFAVIINVVLHFKLKKISMVESLKSVE
ncbi:MAG: FtsX-like permease family protein [Ruminococcus sp.]|nr:FtsX-like permease family protein [Ruminococcus sp.]